MMKLNYAACFHNGLDLHWRHGLFSKGNMWKKFKNWLDIWCQRTALDPHQISITSLFAYGEVYVLNLLKYLMISLLSILRESVDFYSL